MLLLDQGLPRSAAHVLHELGIEAVHAGDLGLAAARDADILQFCRERGQIVVTLDADFHAQLALTGAAGPSVIRIEGLRAEELSTLLVRILGQCGDDLAAGAMVTVTESGVRLRRLPLAR